MTNEEKKIILENQITCKTLDDCKMLAIDLVEELA